MPSPPVAAAPRGRTAARRRAATLVAALALLAVVAAGCDSAPAAAPGADRTTTTVPATTTTTTTVPATTVPVTVPVPVTTTTVDAGTLPQTTAFPSAATARFQAEMRALWQAVVTGDPSAGAPAFFPRAAYLQVKAVPDPAADYEDRLVAEFDLDVQAAHAYLGGAAGRAALLRVVVASAEATWVEPGGCYNRIGYWHAPGARIVYQEDGVTRSIGIASLISWRGMWYVVHFGAVERPAAGGGVVDAPAAGAGVLPPAGGC